MTPKPPYFWLCRAIDWSVKALLIAFAVVGVVGFIAALLVNPAYILTLFT